MALSPALTWSSLTAHYSAAAWQPLAQLAQSFFTHSPHLLTANQFLALAPATAAEPLRGNAAGVQLIADALPEAGPANETYAQYIARGTTNAQPLLTVLARVLATRGITLGNFTALLASEGTGSYLGDLLDADFWAALVQAWQQQVQRRLDTESRWQELVDGQPSAVQQALLEGLYARVAAVLPTDSLESLAAMPLNELARALWSPTPASNDQALTLVIDFLRTAARQVMAQNYLGAELPARFLAAVGPDWQAIAEALLNPVTGVEGALTSVTELASDDTSLASRLAAVPANHPVVYALAAWLQNIIRRFLRANTPAPLAAQPGPLAVRGQVLGADGVPLAGFALLLTQVLTNQGGAERPLGDLRTGPDGRFALSVSRDLYLDGNDEVAEAAASLRIAVYHPGQEISTEPAFSVLLPLPIDGEELAIPTELSLTPAAASSVELADLTGVMPVALSQLLANRNITSLAAVREAGGVQLLGTELSNDPEAQQFVRRLDALAQFELVSPDVELNSRLFEAGISSLRQISGRSRQEFVDQIAENEEEKPQLETYYSQAVSLDSVSQAMGLVAAADRATGTNIVGNSTLLRSLTVTAEAPVTTAQECDCVACRSAVGPTAYLAALLNYAVKNLRVDGLSLTPSFLQDNLLQPFCDLAVSCQSAEEKVCQYRLAIEVIRAHWQKTETEPESLNFPSGAAVQPYLQAISEALLQNIGTSRRELQQAVTESAQAELAKRLRISAGGIQRLRSFVDSPTDSLAETEGQLELLFGLPSTSRDALSTGHQLVEGTSVQLVRWNFENVHWGVNTGSDGNVYLAVVPGTEETAARIEVSTVGSGSTSEDAVATGILVPDTEGQVYRAVLYPLHGSSLRGSVVLKDTNWPASLTSNTHFVVSVLPVVTTERRQYAEQDWQAQDAKAYDLLAGNTAASWNGYKFVIDPDTIGPDDIRTTPAAIASNRAYQIWSRRLAFLQGAFADANASFLTVLTALTSQQVSYAPVGGTAPVAKQPWTLTAAYSSTTGATLVVKLQADLKSGVALQIQNASAQLAALGLSLPAFTRLYALWTQNAVTPLVGEEKEEALQILRQTLKKTFEDTWTAEENPANDPANVITLSGRWFQRSIHEPVEGQWPNLPVAEFGLTASQTPYVDPDEITPLQLPDPYLGQSAMDLWSQRKAELQVKGEAILAMTGATTLARAEAMLEYAYRRNPGVALTTEHNAFASLELANEAYQDGLHPQHTAAITYLQQTLSLRPAEITRLLALRALLQLSQAEWQEMAGLLVKGWKRVIPYRNSYYSEGVASSRPSWIQTEARSEDLGVTLSSFRKQRLTKWRSSATARVQWTTALDQAFLRPLVDPDVLVSGDFRQAGVRSEVDSTTYRNPAFVLYQQRKEQVAGWYTESQATWASVTAVVGLEEAQLTALHEQLHAQVDVGPILRRYNLTPASLDFIINQLASGTSTTSDQAASLRHLLVQIQRERYYADWAREEIALGIYQSPLWFHEPQTPPAAVAYLPWRGSARARRTWQQQLAARFEQADALIAAQQQAVKSAEDRYLPLLRDLLLDTVVAEPYLEASREERANGLSATYLLDFKIACCQHTTRVAQAVEVLQKLIFNYRNGLPTAIAGVVLTLSADAVTTFERDWQWLSSFERWRSLMFLYLYPENVLLPALKPRQTARFRTTISEIRNAARLRPAAAHEHVQDYEAYLRDLQSLTLQTSTQTTLTTEGVAFYDIANPRISLQAGTAASGTAYYNMYYVQGYVTDNRGVYLYPSLVGSSPIWDRIPGTLSVERVVGSAAYRTTGEERFVYVFAFIREEAVNIATRNVTATGYLAYQRFNLQTLVWDEDYTPLEVLGEGEIEPSSVRVASMFVESRPPIITGLRNRREVDLTEAPFSMDLDSPEEPEAALSSPYASYTLGHRAKHVDLFYGALDAQGKKLTDTKNKTVFLINQLEMLSCIMLNDLYIFYTFNAIIGHDHQPYTLLTLSINIDEDLRFEYIASDKLISTPSDLSAPTNRILGPSPLSNSPEANVKRILWRVNRLLGRSQFLFRRAELNYRRFADPKVWGGFATFELAPLNSDGTRAKVSYIGTKLVEANNVGYFFHSRDTFDLYLYYSTGQTKRLTFTLEGTANDEGYKDLDTIANVTSIATLPILYKLQYIGPISRPFLRTETHSKTSFVLPDEVRQELYTNPDTSATNATWKNIVVVDGSQTLPLYSSEQLPALPDLTPTLGLTTLQARQAALATVFPAGSVQAHSFVANLAREAYYGLPLQLAQELLKSKLYEEALRYFRLIYDYTQVGNAAATARLVYPGLAYTPASTDQYDSAAAWLADPDNPYTLAGLRQNAHLRFVVMSVVRCLQAYGNDEFSRDTTESVSRARSLYELSIRILKQDILRYDVQDCGALMSEAEQLVDAEWAQEWQAMKQALTAINQSDVITWLVQELPGGDLRNPHIIRLFREAKEAGQTGNASWGNAFDQAWGLINDAIEVLPGEYETLCSVQESPPSAGGTTGVSLPTNAPRPFVPFLGGSFCVPTNPVPYALLLHAELNLYKIRTCRNIAGVQRELDPYAAPTDTTTGLPVIGANGQLSRTGRLVIPATQYRYAYIIERARQLVVLAQQAEAALLSALEKRDAEAYNLLKARQDIAVSRATVQLQDLRVNEAEDGVDLAELQLQRSELIENQYDEWINAGFNEYEQDMITAFRIAGIANAAEIGLKAVAYALAQQNVASTGSVGIVAALGFATASGIANNLAAGAGITAALASSRAQVQGALATFERRNEEWNFQRNLAGKDIEIGKQQITLSKDRLRIVGQEKRISELQLDNTEAVLNFLTTKFTNAELYDWMSQVLESTYSYFLQQATATARTAEQQLAFERQEAPVGAIQEDYWTPPTDTTTAAGEGATSSVDRKGLTGSVRLLQDLTRLDQYAFETNRRKLQLTKTVSLAQSFPTEFAHFRATGVLTFAVPQRWFDEDFPGHYLRIIRRVRTSVIALVPPVEGIRARLSSTGVSRVVVDGTPFQTLTLPRQPESVSLTSPLNATGLFDLEPQAGELLYPFEGLGVDTAWTFSMSAAANRRIDYATIADVLITLEYTALESWDYAQQVVQLLGTERQELLAFSFRNQFADQWYDLHHAADLAPDDRYVARFRIEAADLPANLRNVRLKAISLYVDAPADEEFTDRSNLELTLTRAGNADKGGSARTNDYGLISTRTGASAGPLYTGNAAALTPLLGEAPAGDWVLTLGNDQGNRLRQRLDQAKVNDIYLILEVEGDVPAYVLV